MNILFIFRVEENGQTTETVEEDGRLTSRKVNGVLQAIKWTIKTKRSIFIPRKIQSNNVFCLNKNLMYKYRNIDIYWKNSNIYFSMIYVSLRLREINSCLSVCLSVFISSNTLSHRCSNSNVILRSCFFFFDVFAFRSI